MTFYGFFMKSKIFHKFYIEFMDLWILYGFFMEMFMDFLWKIYGLFCSQFQTFKVRPCPHLTLPTLEPYSLGLKISTGLTAAAA